MGQNSQNSARLAHEPAEKQYVLYIIDYSRNTKDPMTMNTFFKYGSTSQNNPDLIFDKAYKQALARAKALDVELVLEGELAQKVKERAS